MNRYGYLSSLIIGFVVIFWRRELARQGMRFVGLPDSWQRAYTILAVTVGVFFIAASVYGLLFG